MHFEKAVTFHMSYEIARYSTEFRPQVIALAEHLVSPDSALNDAYFKWKHEDSPYTAAPLVYLALSGGRVVGMRAFHGARWCLGDRGETASWLCACDLVVEPAHRGHNLFRMIMAVALEDLARQGHGPIVNWSASPFTYLASRRAGWRLVGPYARWIRETRRTRHARLLRQRVRRWRWFWRFADRPVALLSHQGFTSFDAAWASSAVPGAISIATKPRPEAMAELVSKVAAPGIQHVRDATYYRWRFENPLNNYRFIFWDESELEGFLVLQASRRAGPSTIGLVDWEASRLSILETLISSVVEAGGYDTLSIWSAALPESMKDCLLRLGFTAADDTRGKPAFNPGLLVIGAGGSDIRAAGEVESQSFSSLDRWGLRMVYSDFY